MLYFITYSTCPLPSSEGLICFLNSCTHHVFVALEHTVSVTNARQCRALQQEGITCDKSKRKMTASAAGEQIDLERSGERGKEKMKERGRGRWCLALFNYHQSCIGFPPPFKIKRQISLNPPLDPRGRITLFFQTAQEPVPFACPLFKESSV